MNAIERLRAVLCAPDGTVSIHGSDGDRAIIHDALTELDALTPAPQVPADAVLRFLNHLEDVMDDHPEVADWVDVQLWNAISTPKKTSPSTPPLNELLGQPEEFNLNEVSGNSGQLASLEQRARELLAIQCEADGNPKAAAKVRSGDFTGGAAGGFDTTIRAITAALSAQPRVTPEHWIEIGKAQALAEFTEQRAAQRRELLEAPQPREVRGVDAGWIFYFTDDEGTPFVHFCGSRDALEQAVINHWFQGDDAEADDGQRMAPGIADELACNGVFHAEDGSCFAKPVIRPTTTPQDAAVWTPEMIADIHQRGEALHARINTPPPGVDVGKLRGLANWMRARADGGWTGQHCPVTEATLRKWADTIDAAAPGTGKDSLQVGGSADLWCLHVQGPDDVHAAPSREAAELVAEQINAHFATTDVKPNAVAAPWPHSPESHAESLTEWEQAWATPPDGAKGER